jgi:hypothetical protein
MAAIVVLSFPLTYFLPVMTGSQQFHLLHHVHGVAFFAWIGLYVLQTQLAARGNMARHREIGLLGFALTGAVILLGYWIAQRAAEIRITKGIAYPYDFRGSTFWISACSRCLCSRLSCSSQNTKNGIGASPMSQRCA